MTHVQLLSTESSFFLMQTMLKCTRKYPCIFHAEHGGQSKVQSEHTAAVSTHHTGCIKVIHPTDASLSSFKIKAR